MAFVALHENDACDGEDVLELLGGVLKEARDKDMELEKAQTEIAKLKTELVNAEEKTKRALVAAMVDTINSKISNAYGGTPKN